MLFCTLYRQLVVDCVAGYNIIIAVAVSGCDIIIVSPAHVFLPNV